MTDITENGALSGLEWVEDHGEKFRFYAALDNYDPPRNFCYGDAYRYSTDTVRNAWIVDNTITTHGVTSLLLDFEKCNFLMDDAHTVQACYVSGWNRGGAYFMLHPFPTNFDEHGQPKMRHDHPDRQVDMTNWALGPRKTYHFKLRSPE